MLNRPKYILFILTIAFSILTVANVILFYLHIEELGIFILTTLATCSFSSFSLIYLFLHFKKNYISMKVVEDENGNIDMNKLKQEIERAQKDKELQNRKKKFEEGLTEKVGQSDYEEFLTKQLTKEMDACQAAYFKVEKRNNHDILKLTSSFAYHVPSSQEVIFEFGEGLAGQVAKEGKLINLKKVPEGYLSVLSGLGQSSPTHLVIIPIKSHGNLKGVLELASFKEFDAEDEKFLTHISEIA